MIENNLFIILVLGQEQLTVSTLIETIDAQIHNSLSSFLRFCIVSEEQMNNGLQRQGSTTCSPANIRFVITQRKFVFGLF